MSERVRAVSARAAVGWRERSAIRARVIEILDRLRTHPGVDNGALASELIGAVLDTERELQTSSFG
jgi:hypothetical protein